MEKEHDVKKSKKDTTKPEKKEGEVKLRKQVEHLITLKKDVRVFDADNP